MQKKATSLPAQTVLKQLTSSEGSGSKWPLNHVSAAFEHIAKVLTYSTSTKLTLNVCLGNRHAIGLLPRK